MAGSIEPEISVALTTFNGERYIAEQLDSILGQDIPPRQIVICDDGSSDKTLDIVDSYGRKYPDQIVIVRNSTNLGFTQNFAKAMAMCSGDFIFLADQDDVWHATKVTAVLSIFAAHPSAWVVIHDAELVDESLHWFGATTFGQLHAAGYSPDVIATGALTAIKREALSLILPIPEKVRGHDIWIHAIARHMGKRVAIPQVLQKLRRHGKNTSTWVVSNIGKTSRIQKVVAGFKAEAAKSYFDRWYFNRAITARIAAVPITPRTRLILDELHAERRAILKRQALLRKRGLCRVWVAVSMLMSGSYRHFNGPSSFIRDLVRYNRTMKLVTGS